MEHLKKELTEKGYTFFKMQDYPEFADDYIRYKKYVCNAEHNLLDKIKSVRLDGVYLKSYYKSFESSRYQVDTEANSFEEISNKVETEYLPYTDLPNSPQYWYYGYPHEVVDEFEILSNKIVEKLYGVQEDSLMHLANLTYYKNDCFLREHRDGQTGTRLCAVLIYLNDEDYKIEWGGNIVFEQTETVPPIYGNIAVLDFKEGNCLHEVKKVVDGYGRYAILDFVSVGTPPEKPNYY
jgi:Rps23 Pro-64 3,4-dihydroxylase Tpa1-like proline 4-hydroxylase